MERYRTYPSILKISPDPFLLNRDSFPYSFSQQKETTLRVSVVNIICCCCSVSKSCPTFCDFLDYTTLGISVLYYLVEFAQIHVNWVGDAISPSHPLPLPSPFAIKVSQQQEKEKAGTSFSLDCFCLLLKHKEIRSYIHFFWSDFSCSKWCFKIYPGIIFNLLLNQFSSVAQSYPTLCNPMDCSMPGFPVHHQLLELTHIHVHQVSEAIWPSDEMVVFIPFSSCLQACQNQSLSNESVLHIRWPKCWSFNFSISPSNEYSGLIFFRIDRFDLLVVQGTLKSLLQQHNSKALILRFTILLHWFKMRKVWFSVIR